MTGNEHKGAEKLAMGDRYERLWREYWRETHLPDQNGEFYFNRQDREEREKSAALTHQEKD